MTKRRTGTKRAKPASKTTFKQRFISFVGKLARDRELLHQKAFLMQSRRGR